MIVTCGSSSFDISTIQYIYIYSELKHKNDNLHIATKSFTYSRSSGNTTY